MLTLTGGWHACSRWLPLNTVYTRRRFCWFLSLGQWPVVMHVQVAKKNISAPTRASIPRMSIAAHDFKLRDYTCHTAPSCIAVQLDHGWTRAYTAHISVHPRLNRIPVSLTYPILIDITKQQQQQASLQQQQQQALASCSIKLHCPASLVPFHLNMWNTRQHNITQNLTPNPAANIQPDQPSQGIHAWHSTNEEYTRLCIKSKSFRGSP